MGSVWNIVIVVCSLVLLLCQVLALTGNAIYKSPLWPHNLQSGDLTDLSTLKLRHRSYGIIISYYYY